MVSWHQHNSASTPQVIVTHSSVIMRLYEWTENVRQKCTTLQGWKLREKVLWKAKQTFHGTRRYFFMQRKTSISVNRTLYKVCYMFIGMSTLAECLHNGWGVHNCGYRRRDVSIICEIGKCSSASRIPLQQLESLSLILYSSENVYEGLCKFRWEWTAWQHSTILGTVTIINVNKSSSKVEIATTPYM